MTSPSLNPAQISRLNKLEEKLQRSVAIGDFAKARMITADIRDLFEPNIRHHRFLRAKLWCCEAALAANETELAMQGVEGVKAVTKKSSKLHLEARALLAVCYLRKKQAERAKGEISEVMRGYNKIKSDASRRLFQAKFLERIDQESLLSELIGMKKGDMVAHEIQSDAESLAKSKSEEEIFIIIGGSLPKATIRAIEGYRSFALLQFKNADLEAHKKAEPSKENPSLGKGTISFLKRVAWGALCKPDSEIYVLWSSGLPKIADRRVMATAVIASLHEWRICVPILATGLIAAFLKSGAEQFCALAVPDTFMTTRKEVARSKKAKS